MNVPHVLLVDADIVVRSALARYLRECGFTVAEAFDNDEARAFLTQTDVKVDVVFADVDMPLQNGFLLASWVRAHHPDVEVILCGTASQAARKAGELCEEGPRFAKPYHHEKLADEIRRLVAARARQKPER
jgi:DNA-binding NtrC family response regulator